MFKSSFQLDITSTCKRDSLNRKWIYNISSQFIRNLRSIVQYTWFVLVIRTDNYLFYHWTICIEWCFFTYVIKEYIKSIYTRLRSNFFKLSLNLLYIEISQNSVVVELFVSRRNFFSKYF